MRRRRKAIVAHFDFERRVQFAETDAAGIVHFTNYLRYMEEAEHAFLRSRGLSAAIEDAQGTLGFPKLYARFEYLCPARFEDLLTVRVAVSGTDGKSLHYEFEFYRGEERIGCGQLTTAFCRFPTDRLPYAVPISDEVLEKLA